ncbi:hypothetical protein D3C72_752770 [compost metagenome]
MHRSPDAHAVVEVLDVLGQEAHAAVRGVVLDARRHVGAVHAVAVVPDPDPTRAERVGRAGGHLGDHLAARGGHLVLDALGHEPGGVLGLADHARAAEGHLRVGGGDRHRVLAHQLAVLHQVDRGLGDVQHDAVERSAEARRDAALIHKQRLAGREGVAQGAGALLRHAHGVHAEAHRHPAQAVPALRHVGVDAAVHPARAQRRVGRRLDVQRAVGQRRGRGQNR